MHPEISTWQVHVMKRVRIHIYFMNMFKYCDCLYIFNSLEISSSKIFVLPNNWWFLQNLNQIFQKMNFVFFIHRQTHYRGRESVAFGPLNNVVWKCSIDINFGQTSQSFIHTEYIWNTNYIGVSETSCDLLKTRIRVTTNPVVWRLLLLETCFQFLLKRWVTKALAHNVLRIGTKSRMNHCHNSNPKVQAIPLDLLLPPHLIAKRKMMEEEAKKQEEMKQEEAKKQKEEKEKLEEEKRGKKRVYGPSLGDLNNEPVFWGCIIISWLHKQVVAEDNDEVTIGPPRPSQSKVLISEERQAEIDGEYLSVESMTSFSCSKRMGTEWMEKGERWRRIKGTVALKGTVGWCCLSRNQQHWHEMTGCWVYQRERLPLVVSNLIELTHVAW